MKLEAFKILEIPMINVYLNIRVFLTWRNFRKHAKIAIFVYFLHTCCLKQFFLENARCFLAWKLSLQQAPENVSLTWTAVLKDIFGILGSFKENQSLALYWRFKNACFSNRHWKIQLNQFLGRLFLMLIKMVLEVLIVERLF